MDEEEIRLALTPFGQVDGSRSRWREGTGLGLPIANALVELHAGELRIESRKHQGTEVIVIAASATTRCHSSGSESWRRGSCRQPEMMAGNEDHAADSARAERQSSDDGSIGRIVSVTGSKAVVLLDNGQNGSGTGLARSGPRWARLLAIDTASTVALAIVSALSVPVPAQREGESEIWIAELGLVGELWRGRDGRPSTFNRGVTPLSGARPSRARGLERRARRWHSATTPSNRSASAASARTPPFRR